MEAAIPVDRLRAHRQWHNVGTVRRNIRVHKARKERRHGRGGAPTNHGPGVQAAHVAGGARAVWPEADERRNPQAVLSRVTEHTW